MLTFTQAIEVAASRWWVTATDDQIVRFQLFEERLCMPFNVFHQIVERVLRRPIWSHEFACPGRLREEYLGGRPAPTFEELLAQLPALKTIVVVDDDDT